MKKIPLIILTGPTAVGKTALSIELAKDLNAEIISADSMQIYEYMDVGSAKVTKEEMDGVIHHLIDEVKPDYAFSVSEFQKRANKYIKDIDDRGKKVLVTGGTGLYLNSLIYDMDFAKSNSNSKLREELELELKENGIDYMHEKLRALEVCLDGKKMQDFSTELKYNENYQPIIIVLNRDREVLYERINKRVDLMMENNLIDEVKHLLDIGYDKNLISMQGIGYKEIVKYLEGEYSLDEAIEIIKRDSRR